MASLLSLRAYGELCSDTYWGKIVQLRKSSKKPSDYLANFPPIPKSRFEVLVLHCLLSSLH